MEAGPGLDVVVASRAAFPLRFVAHHTLGCMPPGEAVALLRAAGADRAAMSDEQAGRIAGLCGCNPLELSLVGGILGGGSCTPQVRNGWLLGVQAVCSLCGGMSQWGVPTGTHGLLLCAFTARRH